LILAINWVYKITAPAFLKLVLLRLFRLQILDIPESK